MFVVFYAVKIVYTCVFVIFSTPYCLRYTQLTGRCGVLSTEGVAGRICHALGEYSLH